MGGGQHRVRIRTRGERFHGSLAVQHCRAQGPLPVALLRDSALSGKRHAETDLTFIVAFLRDFGLDWKSQGEWHAQHELTCTPGPLLVALLRDSALFWKSACRS